MSKKKAEKETKHDLREGLPRVSVPPQNVPLAGGEPFISVDAGPDIASPSPVSKRPGQTTHE